MPSAASCGCRRASAGLALLLLASGAMATPTNFENECSAQSATAADPATACATGSGEGGGDDSRSSSPALVQKRSVVQKTVVKHSYFEEGSDCAQRLNHYSTYPAACIVVRDNKALLVKVPYGKSPGWDFPGGYHKGGEPACETAEREVCEETGYSVRAIAKISGAVFKCEVTGSNVCTKPVDEGFLHKGWFSKSQLDGLGFRGGTWGDKKGMLKQQLHSGPTPAPPPYGSVDACGCRYGIDGWSTTSQKCKSTSETAPEEAAECERRNGGGNGGGEVDECGCTPGVNGWSTTKQRCSSTSQTSPEEAAWCKTRNSGAEFDDCGCKFGVEGWSSTSQKCKSTSATTPEEAAQCRQSNGGSFVATD